MGIFILIDVHLSDVKLLYYLLNKKIIIDSPKSLKCFELWEKYQKASFWCLEKNTEKNIERMHFFFWRNISRFCPICGNTAGGNTFKQYNANQHFDTHREGMKGRAFQIHFLD